jgi:hypothetical protein
LIEAEDDQQLLLHFKRIKEEDGASVTLHSVEKEIITEQRQQKESAPSVATVLQSTAPAIREVRNIKPSSKPPLPPNLSVDSPEKIKRFFDNLIKKKPHREWEKDVK